MSRPIEAEESSPTYLFAIALSIIAGVLLLVGSLRLVGVWDGAVFGALAGALILSVPVAVLLFVGPTRDHLRRART